MGNDQRTVNDRVALVTGGLRGIGLGITRALLAEGWRVMTCGVRAPDQVASVLSELDTGDRVAYQPADISDTNAREQLLAAVRDQFGALHVLVNNAGIGPRVRKDILEAEEEEFEHVLRVNLQGPYFLTQAAARWMVEQKQADAEYEGMIVNISSISATVASPSRGEYCIAKAGVSMATQLWAARLGEFGVPAYEVRPGITKTDMTSSVQEKYDRLIEEGLLVQPRWGTPEDVGKAVAMLARGDLPYSTGQVLMVDGGLTVQRL